VFQNILLAAYHGTFHDAPSNKMNHLCCLTFKTSLDEQEMTSSIYVFTEIGAADFQPDITVASQAKTQSFHKFLKL
jgi:hypothetical protein